MDLILKRVAFRKDGIFSNLLDDQGTILFPTLEHSYLDNSAHYFPKIPDGSFECIRGPHRLEGMTNDFETFEITGVIGHTNILFHVGNFNDDSEGCVLVGTSIVKAPYLWTISNSRIAFDKFMDLQNGLDNFQLAVTSI